MLGYEENCLAQRVERTDTGTIQDNGVSLIRPYSCNTRIPPYPAVSCRILQYPAYPAVSCRILPYPAVSCRILPYPAVSCRILPYPAVSCRILPYRAVSNTRNRKTRIMQRLKAQKCIWCGVVSFVSTVSGTPSLRTRRMVNRRGRPRTNPRKVHTSHVNTVGRQIILRHLASQHTLY